ASPTSERPGSIQMAGIGYFASCAIAKTTLVMPSTYYPGGNGVSSSVYLIPKQPPKFKTGQTKLYSSRHANILSINAFAAYWNPVVSKICEPIWQCIPSTCI